MIMMITIIVMIIINDGGIWRGRRGRSRESCEL